MGLLIRIWTTVAVFFALQSVAHGAVIRFDSAINKQSMDSLMAKVRAAHAAGDRNITLQLTSDGGELNQVDANFDELRQLGVNTSVNDMCASACTALFASGRVRTASNSAQFMFHAAHFEGFRIPKETAAEKKARKAKGEKRKVPQPINPATGRIYTAAEAKQKYVRVWLKRIREASPSLASRLESRGILDHGDDTYMSGRDLRAYGYVND